MVSNTFPRLLSSHLSLGPPADISWVLSLARIWKSVEDDILQRAGKCFHRQLRRDFLRVLDFIRSIDSLSSPAMVDFWLKIGRMADLDENQLRRSALGAVNQSNHGGSGCDWFKCALFVVEWEGDLLFRCNGCHKAVYCRPECQARLVIQCLLLPTKNLIWEQRLAGGRPPMELHSAAYCA